MSAICRTDNRLMLQCAGAHAISALLVQLNELCTVNEKAVEGLRQYVADARTALVETIDAGDP